MPFWGSPALLQQPPVVFTFRGADANVNGTTYAGIRLNADGSMDQRTSNLSYSSKGNWVTPATVTTEEFSIYMLCVGLDGGDTLNTWLQIGNGTAREFWHNSSTLNRAYTMYLSFDDTKTGSTVGPYDQNFTGILSVP